MPEITEEGEKKMFVNELIGAVGQLVVVSLIPFIWWLIFGRKKIRFLKYIGLCKPVSSKDGLKAIMAVILAMLVYGFAMSAFAGMAGDEVTLAGSQFAGSGLKGIPPVLVYGFVRTGLTEEIFFRGFLLKRLQDRFGYRAGNIIQALLFGLLHGIPFGLATGNPAVCIFLTVLPGAVGYLQGWLNEKKFGGSIVPSWIIHGTLNTVVAVCSLF